jgi:tetratricopeptide (TPR) repeat protein
VFDEIPNLRERGERQWAEAAKLEPGTPYRLELLLAAGETFAASQDFARGDESWALALAEAQGAGDQLVEARVLLMQAALGQVRGPEGVSRFHEVAATIRPVLEEASDAEALYKLHQNSARAYAVQGDAPRAREEAELALTWAARAGREDVYATYLLANMELEGAGHVSEVLARAQVLLGRGTGLATFAVGAFAEGNAWLGQFDQARAFVRQHERLWEEAGRTNPTELAAVVELWAGDPAAAEAAARPVVEAQESYGDLGHGAGSVAVLARSVLEQGRTDEALALLDKLERWAAPDDVWTQGELRVLRGRALADPELVREAIELLEPTEYLNVRARAWLELHALTGVGAHRALELYERKGNETGARLARDLIERGE